MRRQQKWGYQCEQPVEFRQKTVDGGARRGVNSAAPAPARFCFRAATAHPHCYSLPNALPLLLIYGEECGLHHWSTNLLRQVMGLFTPPGMHFEMISRRDRAEVEGLLALRVLMQLQDHRPAKESPKEPRFLASSLGVEKYHAIARLRSFFRSLHPSDSPRPALALPHLNPKTP